jgi:hypothetical protein
MLIEILIVWTVGIPLAVVTLALLGARVLAARSTTGPDARGESNRLATVIQFQPIRLEPTTVGRQPAREPKPRRQDRALGAFPLSVWRFRTLSAAVPEPPECDKPGVRCDAFHKSGAIPRVCAKRSAA